MSIYEATVRWRKKFRIRKVGPIEPTFSFGMRILRWLSTATMMLVLNVDIRVFKTLVRRNTRFRDPQLLPQEPCRTAFLLCGTGTIFLFSSVVLLFADRYEFIAAIFLAVGLYIFAGKWLKWKVP